MAVGGIDSVANARRRMKSGRRARTDTAGANLAMLMSPPRALYSRRSADGDLGRREVRIAAEMAAADLDFDFGVYRPGELYRRHRREGSFKKVES